MNQTPKEKAANLFELFSEKIELCDKYNLTLQSDKRQLSKECAIICVDEILNLPINEWIDSVDCNSIDFWVEVKEEISKL